MAPKRPSPLDDHPAGSSSEKDNTSSGEEEEDASKEVTSSEEEEKVDSKPKKSAPVPSSASATDKKVASKKQDSPMNLQAQESSSESGSGSDSGSDSESNAEAGKTVKPIFWKPMEETPKHQKLRENAEITERLSGKRSSPSRETKRAKKGSEALLDDGAVTEHDSKKSGDESKKLFQRLWSEEDEIVILKGITDYKAKKGFQPPADMNDFHDFIKKYLHIDVSRAQLRDKVRRLKKKYKNNVRRGKKGGDPTFTKSHEWKAFGLAKKVWGNEIETPACQQPMFNGTPRNSQTASSRMSLKDKMHADGSLAPSECLNELLDFNKNWGVGGLHENAVKRGLELIQGSKKAEFDKQWKKLYFAEFELFVKRTELVRDQARLMLEAFKQMRGWTGRFSTDSWVVVMMLCRVK